MSSSTSAAALESDPHAPSRTEAHCYYAGLRPNGRGPKLIYRDSSDVYEEPFGPEEYKRLMRLVAVPDDHEFGKDGLWDRVRDKVVELLDAKNIRPTCVDFVRFTWLNKNDQETEHEEDEDDNSDEEHKDDDCVYDPTTPMSPIIFVEGGVRYTTNPTIWVGAAPGALTATAAFEVTKDIRAFLNGLNATGIDIAYRETVPQFSSGHGPALFPAMEYGDPLKEVIDNVSVALSLPISSLQTNMQGTMGPYFHANKRLFAITTRHVVFSPEADNADYRYPGSGPKKDIVLMGDPAFKNYLDSIQTQIRTLLDTVESLKEQGNTLKYRLQNGNNVQTSQIRLDENMAELKRTCAKIDVFKDFYEDIKKGWSRIEQRVIGHVVWAPPIGAGAAPHRYTRDLCVVELYKDRFTHLLGNVLSLGAVLDPSHHSLHASPPDRRYTPYGIKRLLDENNNRNDATSGFEYPDNDLLSLQGILTVEQLTNPHAENLQGNPVRRVLKRGCATNTTVGTLTRYMSFVRKYSYMDHRDSIELPIIPHENETGTFSKGGDSGSVVVSPRGEYVSLLTSGSNTDADGSDITYSTVFEWVWELVLAEFPGASLYWDDIPAFLAAAAVPV